MNWLSQTIAVTRVTLSSIPSASGSSIVAIIGIAGVVIVFTAVLSIAEGFRAAMQGTGDPQTVMVMRSGSDTEMTSGFGRGSALITETPGIERGPDGSTPHRNCSSSSAIRLKRSGTDANVPLRGLSPGRAPGAARAQDRRRADVHTGHQRDRGRPRRVPAVQRPDGGLDGEMGAR